MTRRVHRFWLFVAMSLLTLTQVRATVVADFSADVTSGCPPLTVNYTNLSTGATAYSWNFGNGNTANTLNGGAVYSLPGLYTVMLTASNGGVTDAKSIVITVFTKPVASFTTSAPQCTGQTITFHDNSTPGSGALANWHWDFGDGNATNTVSGTSSHTYSSGGTYPASLIVTDANGCTSNIVVSVVVNAVPVAAFTASPLSGCTAPLLVTFSNTSTAGSATYSWNFGDGGTSVATNPTHTYATLGIYTVKLFVTQNGCVDSLVRPAYIIIKNITADFKADTTRVCQGQPVVFTDLSVPLSSTRTWTFGDGSTSVAASPSHSYLAPGTYTVSLQAFDPSGCTNTKVKNNYITVLPTPHAGFTNTTPNGCSVPFNVTFSDTTTGAVSWSWNFGDGGTSVSQNPMHPYTTPGVYSVKLIVKNANGCIDSITKTSLVDIAFTPAFFMATPLNGCIPLTVHFTDTTTTGIIPPASYIWDFGNGTVITTAGPTVTAIYNTVGIFTVKLIVVTATGCRDSLTKIGYIQTGTPPVTNFSGVPTPVCFGQPVAFTDLSSGGDNSWLWNYGDGATDVTQNPSHTYGDTGTFTVQLIAKMNGCADTLTKLNYIKVLPPIPKFTFVTNCAAYFSVTFTNTSVGADSVTWDFGDGTFDFSNNNSPTHVYLTRGIKSIKLTAFNKSTGCSFSSIQQLTVAQPVAKFGATPNPPYGCIPLNIAFVDTSQDANTYLWNFGDGITSAAVSPSHVYGTKGVYAVTLTVTDVNGCSNTQTIPGYVHALAVDLADFTGVPQNGCAPLPVVFQDASVSDSTLVSWSWNFGDGSPVLSGGATVSHTYALRGSYNVSLTVTDKDGCTAAATKLNYINPTKPYPVLTVDTFSCKGNVLPFNATATTGTTPLTYSWTFGDGFTATTATNTTTHSYAGDNLYTVSLKVTDPNGCDSVVTKNIRILKPVASFRDSVLNFGCGTEQVQFINQSVGFVNSWLWNFGNGATSTLTNPVYTYTSPGTYQVKLIVTNVGGCMDSIVKDSIVVVPGPLGSFTFQPKIGCVPLTVHFTAISGNSSYFTWDFGDGTVLPKTNMTSVTHTYLNPITITPILLLGDTLPNHNVCELPATNLTGSVTATQLINLSILPAGPVTISDDQLIPLTSVVSGAITNNLVYSWTPSTGLNCTSCQDPLVTPTGQTIMYYVTITDLGSGGCMNSDSVLVVYDNCTANPTVPNIFTPNGDGVNDILYANGICINTNFRLAIYDRWGVQLFLTSSRHEGWDGRTPSGEEVKAGVYYYVITADGKSYKGFIELIR
jgi:gliding motility-associated-like protein